MKKYAPYDKQSLKSSIKCMPSIKSPYLKVQNVLRGYI